MNSEDHAKKVRGMPCMVCGIPGVTHHPYAGSMRERGIMKGASMRVSNWLVIPLCDGMGEPGHHNGREGVHRGVETWEGIHGTQAGMVDRLCDLFGLDLWALAAAEVEQDRAARRYQPPVRRIKPDAEPDPLTLCRMKSAPKTKLATKLPAGRNNKRPAKVLERT